MFTYCRQESAIFHPIFTQPGKSLLAQPRSARLLPQVIKSTVKVVTAAAAATHCKKRKETSAVSANSTHVISPPIPIRTVIPQSWSQVGENLSSITQPLSHLYAQHCIRWTRGKIRPGFLLWVERQRSNLPHGGDLNSAAAKTIT